MRTLILVAIAFITLQTTAQDQRKRDTKDSRKVQSEMLKDLSPEEIATLQSKKMTLNLDLTEKQQIQVKELLLQQATLRKEKRDARKKMKENGEDSKPSKEERVKMMNTHLDEQIEMKQKMKSILSAEQYDKWEKTQNKRRFKNKGKHKRKTKD